MYEGAVVKYIGLVQTWSRDHVLLIMVFSQSIFKIVFVIYFSQQSPTMNELENHLGESKRYSIADNSQN